MNELDKKIKKIFSNEFVYKTKKNYGIFTGKQIPSFIKDWLIKKYSYDDGSIDENSINMFFEEHLPTDKEKGKFKSELLLGEEKTILAKVKITPDIKKNIIKFSLPDLNISEKEARIPKYLSKDNEELQFDEAWGVITLNYSNDSQSKENYIEMTDFKAFNPYEVEFSYFKEARNQFSIDEWIDVLIRAMEYQPDSFVGQGQKLMFLSRLLVFIEPRLNIIELAPKGTGKSYVFGNLSKYGWLIGGGIVTRAKLMYDIKDKKKGVIATSDYVAMDEVQTIQLRPEEEIAGALKSYLEAGYFNIADVKIESNSGFILLGNIKLDNNMKPEVESYFSPLPRVFRESAFLDRFHGFIEGWKLPRLNTDMVLKGVTLNVEYFSEILHLLRTQGIYSKIIDELIIVPPKSDMRDVKAVKRLATAYFKLFFPHVESVNDVNIKEFETYCFEPAMEKRRLIKYELHKIDREFKEDIPNLTIKRILNRT